MCGSAACTVLDGVPAAAAAGTCDGTGTCNAFTTLCGTYVCDSSTASCLASCSSLSDCSATAFCIGGTCCPSLGSDLYVNAASGADSDCCGSASQPCLTLTQAMALVRAALDETGETASITLHALVGAGDAGLRVWTAPETWPLILDHGVTLEAPDVDFPGPTDGGLALWITTLDGGDGQGPVEVRGELDHPVILGFDIAAIWDAGLPDGGRTLFPDAGLEPIAFAMPGTGLYIDYREAVLANFLGGGEPAVEVNNGGTLEVGDGPVSVGLYEMPDGGEFTTGNGTYGIDCFSTDGGTDMLVTDSTASGAGQLILPAGTSPLGILSGCRASLTHAPVFGPAPVGGSCPHQANNGLVAYNYPPSGPVPQVTLAGVTMQCLGGSGVYVASDGFLNYPDAGHSFDGAGLVIDGGTFIAVSSAIYADNQYSDQAWYLAHLQLGAPSCVSGLKGEQAFSFSGGETFGSAVIDDVTITCQAAQSDLYNYDPNTVVGLGDLVLNDVTVTGTPDVGISIIASTIEATGVTATGNHIGLEVYEGTLTVDGGELSCNSMSNLHVGDVGVGVSTSASVANVIWNHAPPTECTSSCHPDAGAYPDAGACRPCPTDGGFVDILLDDSTDSYAVTSAQQLGGICQ